MDVHEYVATRFDPPQTSTEAQYLPCVTRILLHFEQAYGCNWGEDVGFFEGFLEQSAASLARATWRRYRSALRYYLRSSAPVSLMRALDAMDGGKRRPWRARHRKYLPDVDMNALIAAAKRKPDGSWARWAVIWLRIGRATGLRPGEWWKAKLIGGLLIVGNAKYAESGTGTRAFGPQRTLDISGLSRELREEIHRFLTEMVAYYDYTKAEKQASQALQRLQDKLWKRRKTRYVLYSARHQCAADAKRAGLDRCEVAALLGHASIDTAGEHYGRRSRGRRGDADTDDSTPADTGFRVQPSPADVEQVRMLNQERMAQASAAIAPGLGPA